ncbi:hypothetical protein [Aquimarina algiphila]|uniref:hypothetical protein n=1 Tax=Aquimarina algiphila TaxID=2047982 RepID=UPI00232EEE94|nr:hypothetical protein [Aquimarina algiphila]
MGYILEILKKRKENRKKRKKERKENRKKRKKERKENKIKEKLDSLGKEANHIMLFKEYDYTKKKDIKQALKDAKKVHFKLGKLAVKDSKIHKDTLNKTQLAINSTRTDLRSFVEGISTNNKKSSVKKINPLRFSNPINSPKKRPNTKKKSKIKNQKNISRASQISL